MNVVLDERLFLMFFLMKSDSFIPILMKLCLTNSPGSLGELQESVSRLDRDGFIARPCWEILRRGVRPRPPLIVELGECHYGWQHFSSSGSEHHCWETVVLAQSCACRPGPFAITVWTMCQPGVAWGAHCSSIPREVLEWLRLRLLITEARCECGGSLDF